MNFWSLPPDDRKRMFWLIVGIAAVLHSLVRDLTTILIHQLFPR